MIIEILGVICSCATELVVPGAYHFMRRKSVIPSQVSSTLRRVFPAFNRLIIFRANCWRRTRFFSELPWMDTGKTLRYLIFK